MKTSVNEIADGIIRVSTFLEEPDFTFNQFLIIAEQPMLFHCGPRGLYASVSEAVASVLPLTRLRWISFGHFEADESGTLNEWLAAAPSARVAVGAIGCMVSVNDIAIRPPRALDDEEVLDLGGKRVRYLATPHVPHGWDAGVIYEEVTKVLFCGDLFTRMGGGPAASEDDPVGPAFAAEDVFGATALTARTAPTIRRLANLQPRLLALMHGAAFVGNCETALRQLADGYETLFTSSLDSGAHD